MAHKKSGKKRGSEASCQVIGEKFVTTEKVGDAAEDLVQSVSSGSNSGVCVENASLKKASSGREQNKKRNPKHKNKVRGFLSNGFYLKNVMDKVDFSDTVVGRNARALAVSTLKVISQWLERQRPILISITTTLYDARDRFKPKFERSYPIVLKWLKNFGNTMLLLSIICLDCTFRGIESILRMGTTSLFFVVWCIIFSVIAMVGMMKLLMVLAIAALTAVFVGFTVTMLVVAVFGTISLWFYESFCTTLLVIFFGGWTFSFFQERVAFLIATIYSGYCAWMYGGWLGLLFVLTLSIISTEALIYYLKNHTNKQAGPDGMHGHQGFSNDESAHATFSENRGPGVASTSGVETMMTSKGEVVRLLNCTDHYSALGLSRYQNVDVDVLKREYRKKAMLVHPDKNMGDEKAAEAFKKLQNAYEVLLDSLKRKAYDDELRQDELLNFFRRSPSASQKNGRHGFFPSRSVWSEADGEELVGESRRIACKKCGNFHVWVQTKRSISQARWCQECKVFHEAKDGDGWVEQSSELLFFGFLTRVQAYAFVCADNKIYDASEWYLCQEMSCPFNTHEPSFHVNTSLVTSKQSTGKGSSSGQRGGTVPMPNETMTEEEFVKWFQNAAQGDMFDNFTGTSTSAENPFPKAGSSSKSSSGSGNRRTKKGKKQW